jgi:hypothetical protein
MHPRPVQDYLHAQSELEIDYVVREADETIEGDPVSFNPLTDTIHYGPSVCEHTETIIVKGFRYQGQGFAISGKLKKPLVLSQTISHDGEEVEFSENEFGVTDAIYAAIGPCNRDVVDIL